MAVDISLNIMRYFASFAGRWVKKLNNTTLKLLYGYIINNTNTALGTMTCSVRGVIILDNGGKKKTDNDY